MTQLHRRQRRSRTQAKKAGTHATPLSNPQGVSYVLRSTPMDSATCGEFFAYDGPTQRMNRGGA
jgi:hypothetical protein